MAVLNQFYQPPVLDVQNFKLSPNGVYTVPDTGSPDTGSFSCAIEHFAALPQVDDPQELLSMCSNATLALQVLYTHTHTHTCMHA